MLVTRDDRSRLLAEIHEQPDVVARLVEREAARVRALAAAYRRFDPAFVLVVARGTSDNAARYAQYALGLSGRLVVALAAPSLTTLYRRPPDASRALVVGISQSGRSPDVVETVARARRQGAPTLAIVNDETSPLARAAGEVLPLHAGLERSVAATKTYTAQLAAIALLAASISGRRKDLDDLARIPEAMREALSTQERASAFARVFAPASRAVVLARGVNYPTAHEIALKLKELALLSAEAFSSADFAHGPIALAERDLPALIVSPPGGVAARELEDLASRLRRRGSRVVTIGSRGSSGLPLPSTPEVLSPLVAVIPGQLLAFHLARRRKLDPENPRGLRKVTRTR